MQKIIFIVNNQFLVKTNENDVEKNFEDFYITMRIAVLPKP